ncbi:MAG: cupredoxin domain-containing protein [Dehalococcoidia bacterium]
MNSAGVSVVVSGEAPTVAKGQVRARISLPRILLLAWVVTLLAFGVAALWQVLPGNGSEKAVTIRARSDALGHEEITMSRGQTLEFTLISLDTSHTIVFEGLGVSVTAGPSETVTRRFTVDEAGTYTFRCIRPEHEGVEGTLTVTQ